MEKEKKVSRIERIKENRFIKFFRNKYRLTFAVFFIYALFLDDVDVFKIISQNQKLNRIEHNQAVVSGKLQETKKIVEQLNNPEALEKFAREQKLFKMDDEDIFVISHE